MSKAFILNTGDVVMAPVPLLKGNYAQATALSADLPEAHIKAKLAMARALEVYENERAWLQPVKLGDRGRTVWEVRFPQASRYTNGPRRDGALDALFYNIIKNKQFPSSHTHVDTKDATLSDLNLNRSI